MKEDNDFEEIVREYLKPMYNFVFRLVGDREGAEDIAQETFLKVWRSLNKFDKNKSFKTWIFTIARNSAIDWLRKKKEIVFSELNTLSDARESESFADKIMDTEDLPDEVFYRKELIVELEKALSEVRPDLKEIIILHHMEEMIFQEIAEVVGKPLNTIKSQYRRALHQIRLSLRI